MTDQEKIAKLLHASLTERGISQSWETCRNRMQYRKAAEDLLEGGFVIHACDDIDQRAAYTRNALEGLADLRSSIIGELTGPSDEYLQASFLAFLDDAEDNMRRALL